MIKKVLILLVCFFVLPVLWDSAGAEAACTYYVSSSAGNDSYNGTSSSSPWQTISRLNQQSLSPGETVCFKSGDVWRLPEDAYLNFFSGNSGGYITYTSYGTGAKPLFLGSVNKNSTSDWYFTGVPNVWATADYSFPYAVGNLIFNNEDSTGTMDKSFDINRLDEQGDYYFDTARSRVLLYSTSNPASYYSDIECALHRHMFNMNGKSYINVNNLHLSHGGSHGIWGYNSSYILITDNDLSYIGGAIQWGPVRYGNAIEFWNSNHDTYVERNRIWEIFDAGVTTQGSGTNQKYNQYFRNNVIWNTTYCYEYWNKPSSSISDHIYFENNTCANSGQGFGGRGGTDMMFFDNSALTTNFYVRNNIFYEAGSASLSIGDHPERRWNGLASLVLDYNAYYKPTDSQWPTMTVYPPCVWCDPWGITCQDTWDTGHQDLTCTTYTMDEFATYQADSGKDPNSITTDPLFVDIANNDYRPMAGSPVCTASSSGSYVGALPCVELFSSYDLDQDWTIDDTELQNAIDDWAAGNLGDFELLDIIDLWAAGCYEWDDVALSLKPGCTGDMCTFDLPVKTVGVPPGHNYYSSLQSGYDAAGDGDIIQIQDRSLTGNLNINMDKSVTLEGGYDCDYTYNTGTTVLKGAMNITTGSLRISGGSFAIKK